MKLCVVWLAVHGIDMEDIQLLKNREFVTMDGGTHPQFRCGVSAAAEFSTPEACYAIHTRRSQCQTISVIVIHTLLIKTGRRRRR